jgi:hypothetical protein
MSTAVVVVVVVAVGPGGERREYREQVTAMLLNEQLQVCCSIRNMRYYHLEECPREVVVVAGGEVLFFRTILHQVA